MTQEMRKVVLETVIPSKFKYIARDLNGSVHVFENEPNLDYGTNKSPFHAICGMYMKVKQCSLVLRLQYLLVFLLKNWAIGEIPVKN